MKDRETFLRGRIQLLKRLLWLREQELEDLHRGETGTFGRLRYGDRVKLNYDYTDSSPHTAPKGSIGKITHIWNDGQVVVTFENGYHAAYWPNVLEWAPEEEKP